MRKIEPKIVAIIPAHLASVRFLRKILFPFLGYPMIEHVRRRAIMSSKIDDVYVATCDREIAEIIEGNGGKVIMTSDGHLNGTSRVAEASMKIDCTHVVLLQGDEPLLLPEYIDLICEAIRNKPHLDAWNGTGPIKSEAELDRHSFVKCAVNQNDKIMYCFRRSPSFAPLEQQIKTIRKVLGIIAYRKEYLELLIQLPPALTEISESIEQMRIVENDGEFFSVKFQESLPSVNEPHEVKIVEDYLRQNERQQDLFAASFGIKN